MHFSPEISAFMAGVALTPLPYKMEIEDKVKSMEYNISDPLIVVYNEIEELARLGTAAANPFSNMQQV